MLDAASPGDMTLRLGASEAELVIAALRLLRSTLGREEADELTEVMALLARLERARDDAAAKQR